MPETGNNINQNQRLVLRVGRNTLSFSVIADTSAPQLRLQPYTVRSGISMAANLRQAFAEDGLLQEGFRRAMVMLDTPTLLVPVEEFREDEAALLYRHAFIDSGGLMVLHNVLPFLNAVAVYGINKDLHMVLTDRFSDVRFATVSQPVWMRMHQRSFSGVHHKLFGFFHDDKLDVFAFDKNRFRFANTFATAHYKDAVYFLLYTWSQLGYDANLDELHLSGLLPEREECLAALRRFLRKVFVVNPVADFNRSPMTQVKGASYDLLCYYFQNS